MRCTFKYKCRNCGELMDGPSGGSEAAMHGLLAVLHGIPFLKFIGTPPEMVRSHACSKGNFIGIADLIGYSIEG